MPVARKAPEAPAKEAVKEVKPVEEKKPEPPKPEPPKVVYVHTDNPADVPLEEQAKKRTLS